MGSKPKKCENFVFKTDWKSLTENRRVWFQNRQNPKSGCYGGPHLPWQNYFLSMTKFFQSRQNLFEPWEIVESVALWVRFARRSKHGCSFRAVCFTREIASLIAKCLWVRTVEIPHLLFVLPASIWQRFTPKVLPVTLFLLLRSLVRKWSKKLQPTKV